MTAAQLALAVDRRQARLPRPVEPIVRTAVLDPTGRYRFELVRSWGAGPRLAIAGKNPSKANAKIDDPTMLRDMGFAFRWGYGSLVKVNVEPLVSPRPEKLIAWRRDRSEDAQAARLTNLIACGRALSSANAFLAAWGSGMDDRVLGVWLAEMRRIVGKRLVWTCLGTNENGTPRHTLARGRNRIPDDATPAPWVGQ